MKPWMIYGATGFIGKLIVAEAARRGYQPILAGRDELALMHLADQWDFEYRVFDLQYEKKIKDQLSGITLILNCAGPFVDTAPALLAAALKYGCHYLDVGAESPVLESSLSLHLQAREQGVVILPSVGFEVMAADALAVSLYHQMPQATHLELSFYIKNPLSAGLIKTALSLIRHNKQFVLNGGATAISVKKSTGIKNISVSYYIEKTALKRLQRFRILFKIPFIKVLCIRYINRNIYPPTNEEMQLSKNVINARVFSDCEESLAIEKKITTQDIYQYSVKSSLMAVEHILADKVMPGAYTPAEVIDPQVILAFNIQENTDQAPMVFVSDME